MWQPYLHLMHWRLLIWQVSCDKVVTARAVWYLFGPVMHACISLTHWSRDKMSQNIFKCIFLNENVWISLKISLKFIPMVRNNTIPALVLKMAWCWPGNKPLSKPVMVSLLKHICVTRPQWVNILRPRQYRRHFADDILKCIFLNENVWI